MEETEYKDNEKVLYRTRCKFKTEETDCLVTSGHVLIGEEEPIKIPLSHVEYIEMDSPDSLYYAPLSNDVKINCKDVQNNKYVLHLEMVKSRPLNLQKAIYRQLVGRYINIDHVHTRHTPLGRFLFKVKESYRDKTRDNFCAALQSLRVDAQMAVRGRFEEKIRDISLNQSGYSLGIIRISEGPISWVNILKDSESRYDRTQYTVSVYYINYGVADSKLVPNSPQPILSNNNYRWEGEDFGVGIIDRLNNDVSLQPPFLPIVKIAAIADYGCWLISTKVEIRTSLASHLFSFCTNLMSIEHHEPQPEGFAPTALVWKFYQTTAQHLLVEWPKQY